MILILMGVSGSGKTTLGLMLSHETGWTFLDADDFHSAANKAKMASGHPLTDEDRAPWLAALHAQIEHYSQRGESMILACSALRAKYRTVLEGGLPAGTVRFALLSAPFQILWDRLHHRKHAFMDPDLLNSQLQTLEAPGSEAWTIDVSGTPEQSLQQLLGRLRVVGELSSK